MPDGVAPVTGPGNFTSDADAEAAFTKAINSGQTVALGAGSGWNPSSTAVQPNIVPPAVKQAAAQAPPTAPSPIYTGPSVNSIPHVANQLGTNAVWNQQTGQFNVNGVPIQPTSVINGIHHAPVSSIAQAAGFPPTNIQQTETGVNVMPRTDTSGITQNIGLMQQNTNGSPQVPLNPYWQGVQRQGGAYATPINGESVQQLQQSEAQKYGINPNQVQVTSGGHTFVPWQFVAPVAQAQSAFESAQVGANSLPQQPVQGTGMTYQDQLNQAINNYLSSVAQNAPVAPPLTQLPTFNSSMISPFSFNAQQDAQDQFNALNPQFQQQMLTADLKNNDDMNRRGLFNSGIAQQAENQLNTGILGQETQAVNKQVLADRTEAFKEWQAQAQMQLNAYKMNLDAAYQQGQLTNAQYADSLKVWQEGNAAMQNAMDQQAKLVDQMQSNMLPWDMGPTPQQQITDQLDQLKTILPFTNQTANNIADNQTKVDINNADNQTKIDINNANNQLAMYKFQHLSAFQAQQVQNWLAQDTLKQEAITGYDTNHNPTLDRQKFDQTVIHDTQMVDIAAAGASDTQTRTQLDALGTELKSVDSQIQGFTTANKAVPQNLIDQRDSIRQQMNTIATDIGSGNLPK